MSTPVQEVSIQNTSGNLKQLRKPQYINSGDENPGTQSDSSRC